MEVLKLSFGFPPLWKNTGYMKAEPTVAFWIVNYMKKNHHGGLKLRVEMPYIKDHK